MRIRSTKPEFWRSKTIAALPWDVRLVLKGLESYVDDNGVGKDDIALIAADVFPRDLSGNPPETLRRLTEAVSLLFQHGLIARYTHDGEELLYIDRWSDVQYVQKPRAGRFPRPDGTKEYTQPVNPESYRNVPEVVRPKSGEQGNRGTGEQGNTPTLATEPYERPRESKSVARMNALNETATTALARDVAASFNRWADNGIDSKTQAETAIQVDQLLADGIDPHQIADGLKAWHASDSWSPSQIRRFVSKAAKPANTSKPTKATLKAVDITAMGAALIAEFEETA